MIKMKCSFVHLFILADCLGNNIGTNTLEMKGIYTGSVHKLNV